MNDKGEKCVMKKIELNEIQKIEMEIINDIDKVCRENKLRYTLIGGSLIGAVRHNGFIPWDDDIDIAMLREDYNKFVKIYDKNKNKQFSIFESSLNDEYYYPFIKVSDNRTYLKEKNYKKIENMGVSLDVFPIDSISSKFSKRKLNKISFYRKGLSKCFSEQKKVTSNIIKRMIKQIVFSKDYKYYLGKIEKLSQIDNEKECTLAGVLVNGTGEKDIFPKNIFNYYVDLQFENLKLMAIKDYEIFLRHRFGDYMKMPPKEQQIPHTNDVYWK